MTNEPTLWEQFLLDPMTYIYWGVAIISSLVFTIQTLLLLCGSLDHGSNLSGRGNPLYAWGLGLAQTSADTFARQYFSHRESGGLYG